MIYDCFTFFNEFELLNARLHELNGHVYKHVLVESTKTFSNQLKPLFFEENKLFYTPFLDRIIHVIVDDMPDDDNAWIRETHQRNAIMRGLGNAHENDLILVSDVDEIPDGNVLDYVVAGSSFRQQFFYYDVYTELEYLWHGTTCQRFGSMTTPQHLRDQRYNLPAQRFPGYHGWHMSYFGGPERIRTKIQSMSDTYLNIPEYTSEENLRDAIDKSRDLFGRQIGMTRHEHSPIPERILTYL
jgi:beta-1,4-mannosyl-glycoprotein beta-1,4-N-acetylglucosaminyltransferase